MEISAKSLREQYEKLGFEKLVELSRNKSLTDIEASVLDEIIHKRREQHSASSQKNMLENLWEGNFGLAMTYWVYGVLGGFVWGVGILALKPDPEGDLIKLIWLIFTLYYFVIYVGTWKAANKYVGRKVWSILAKFAIIIVVLPVAIHLLKWLVS
jgi:hypothetical protein